MAEALGVAIATRCMASPTIGEGQREREKPDEVNLAFMISM